MLIAIDIGNTNIVIGIFNHDELVTKFRLATDVKKTADEYFVLIKEIIRFNNIKEITHSIYSSVVPPLNKTFDCLLKKYFNTEPVIVSDELDLGIKLAYKNNKEIGADRIVNAVAGYNIYGAPLIIIDFGTATTICYLDKDGVYQGGIILAGINLLLESLHIRTAKLPKVEISIPKEIIGKDTISSIQSGAYYGTIGQIDYIVNLILKNIDSNCKIIATGGLADIIVPGCNIINTVDNELTLKGLRILYSRVRKNVKL